MENEGPLVKMCKGQILIGVAEDSVEESFWLVDENGGVSEIEMDTNLAKIGAIVALNGQIEAYSAAIHAVTEDLHDDYVDGQSGGLIEGD